MKTQRASAVVVTFNRRRLLVRCLEALFAQTTPAERIIVVDNASSDGTQQVLDTCGYLRRPDLRYHRLPENVGGAGGFHEGIEKAMAEPVDWLWLMDDDALPNPEALSKLRHAAQDQRTIYGSAAVGHADGQEQLCWPAELAHAGRSRHATIHRRELGTVTPVRNLPFLGLFVHRSLIDDVGLPDKELFLSGDDAEFCARASAAGARIVLVRDSILRHPLPLRTAVRIFGRTVHVLALPPWKRYYEVRNRLLIAKKYYGTRLWTEALPGTLVRWLTTLTLHGDRWRQSQAFLRGLRDGLTGASGKTWEPGP